MLSQAVESLSLIPFSIVVLLVAIAMGGCLIALLHDAGTRDTGLVTQFGLCMLGIGIAGCLCVGLWNMTVGFAKFSVHRQAVAASESVRE